MTAAIPERVARAIYEDRNGRGCRAWSRLPREHQAMYLSDARAALAIVRAVLLEEAAPPLWTVANHDTYAVLIAPDGHIAARFHVVAECEAVARVLNGAIRVGGGET